MSFQDIHLRVTYPSAEMQSVYPTALADWAAYANGSFHILEDFQYDLLYWHLNELSFGIMLVVSNLCLIHS